MIAKAIKNCLRQAKEKGWEKTYWAFDIHGTIVKPNFRLNDISREFYPGAVDVLQALSKRKEIVKILYTCSTKKKSHSTWNTFPSMASISIM